MTELLKLAIFLYQVSPHMATWLCESGVQAESGVFRSLAGASYCTVAAAKLFLSESIPQSHTASG